tara:strand:- start:1066 stop:2076 length:1011 start_codon:yes stop_codon:yes gene_type:complete
MQIKPKQIKVTENKIVIGNSSGNGSELAYTVPSTVGTNGHVLTSNGTNVVFQAVSGGGGGSSISDSDSDTKIQVEESSDEDKIRFDTAGSERMIITDEGKIGIGTSSPSHALDVSGDVRVRGNDIRDNSGNPAITMDGSANVTIPNNLIVDGDGSTGGITITDGSIAMRTGTGSVAKIDMYCEVNNAHKISLKAPAHSAFSGNIDFVLPPTEGSNGQYLKTDGSGNTSWGTVSGSSASRPSVTEITSTPYTISNPGSSTLEDIYVCDSGASVVNLPTAVGNEGLKVQVKNRISSAITVNAPNPGTQQTIDGSNSISIASQYESLTFVSDNSNWNII